MASTTPDRRSPTRPDGCPRIDESVFTAIEAVPVGISVARFERWFACFATAGEQQ